MCYITFCSIFFNSVVLSGGTPGDELPCIESFFVFFVFFHHIWRNIVFLGRVLDMVYILYLSQHVFLSWSCYISHFWSAVDTSYFLQNQNSINILIDCIIKRNTWHYQHVIYFVFNILYYIILSTNYIILREQDPRYSVLRYTPCETTSSPTREAF